MAFKQILEDTLSLFSIPQFLGCQDGGCGFEESFKHSGILHVAAGSLLYYTTLCQGILPLAYSAIISFWGCQAKSWGLEGSFKHPGIHYQHNIHTSACSTCCSGSFLLTIRLGIEKLVAIPSGRCKPYTLCYLRQGDSLSYAGGTLG